MSEEKPEAKKIKLIITLPTKQALIDTLSKLFPGIVVEVEEETKPEERSES